MHIGGRQGEIFSRNHIFDLQILLRVFATFNGFNTGNEDLRGAVHFSGGAAADRHFAGVNDLRLALAGQEVEVLGIPLGIEVEIGGIGPACALDQSRTIRRKILHEATAGVEEVDSVVVLPRLEIETDLGVVFGIEFIHGDFCTDFRRGDIVFHQKFFDICAGKVGGFEEDQVQCFIAADPVGAADIFRHIICHIGTGIAEHGAQFSGGAVLRLINIHGLTGHGDDFRLIQRGNDAVNALPDFAVFKAVIFGRDHEDAGAVTVLDRLNPGIAFIHSAGLDDLAEIAAQFVGIGIFQDVSLGHNVRVVVGTDEMNDLGTFFHFHVQACINGRIFVPGGCFIGKKRTGSAEHGCRSNISKTFHRYFSFSFRDYCFASSSNAFRTPWGMESSGATGTARAVTK